jgi:hypothetical protein
MHVMSNADFQPGIRWVGRSEKSIAKRGAFAPLPFELL